MFSKGHRAKRCQEHVFWLIDLDLWPFYVQFSEAFFYFLDDLDSIFHWHLQVQKHRRNRLDWCPVNRGSLVVKGLNNLNGVVDSFLSVCEESTLADNSDLGEN